MCTGWTCWQFSPQKTSFKVEQERKMRDWSLCSTLTKGSLANNFLPSSCRDWNKKAHWLGKAWLYPQSVWCWILCVSIHVCMFLGYHRSWESTDYHWVSAGGCRVTLAPWGSLLCCPDPPKQVEKLVNAATASEAPLQTLALNDL